MNEENLLFMRSNYHNNLINFIRANYKVYTADVINEGNIVLSELLQLLDTDIPEEYKLKLLDSTSEPISIRNARYSERIKQRILLDNFNIKDISYLVSDFDKVGPELKLSIRKIAIKNIDVILEMDIVRYDLLIELLGSDDIQEMMKKELLILQLNNLNETHAINCFCLLGMDDVISLFSGKRPKLEVNKDHERILSVLETKGWISRFTIDYREPNFYRAWGRRNRMGENVSQN